MSGSTPTLVRGGTVLAGAELEPLTGTAVLVEGGRIVRVAPEHSVTVGREWTVVDADGHTVIFMAG